MASIGGPNKRGDMPDGVCKQQETSPFNMDESYSYLSLLKLRWQDRRKRQGRSELSRLSSGLNNKLSSFPRGGYPLLSFSTKINNNKQTNISSRLSDPCSSEWTLLFYRPGTNISISTSPRPNLPPPCFEDYHLRSSRPSGILR